MQNSEFDDLLHVIAKESIENFTNTSTQEFITTLNTTQIEALKGKIPLLPEPYITIVLLYYGFENSYDEIEYVTEETNIAGKLQYANLILVQSLSLPMDSVIESSILKETVKEILPLYVEDYNQNIAMINPNYSSKFRKKLKGIKIPYTKTNLIMHIGKRIAVACLALVIAFTATMTVSAKFREFVINWLIETFPTFSTFQSVGEGQELTQENLSELYRYQPTYLPEGFSFSEQIERPVSINRYYYDAREHKIVFITSFTGHPVNLNTEGSEIVETTIVSKITGERVTAYKWEKEDTSFIVWSTDGYDFYLFGNVSLEEIVVIAESIKKNN